MAQTGYFDEDYEGLKDMLARAYGLGAKEIETEVLGDAPALGPLPAGVRARAILVRADGVVIKRTGTARLGDARVTEPLPAAEDIDVEDRAQRRAARAAIRFAYPDKDEEGQPPHVKLAQAYVRRAAPRFHLSRDELAAVVHERYGVASLNDVTPEQTDAIVEWLEEYVSGDEG